MIQESITSSNDGAKGITYADFLSQWNNDRESFDQEYQNQTNPSAVPTAENSTVNSGESPEDTVDDLGGVKFKEQKGLSLRKLRRISSPTGLSDL